MLVHLALEKRNNSLQIFVCFAIQLYRFETEIFAPPCLQYEMFLLFCQTFLGQKYGFRPIPSKIPSTEFEKLLSNLTDQEEKAVLEKWFKCDLNAIPPTYVLQPVSSHFPDHLCRDSKQRKFALQQWSQVFAQIQNLLRREARKEFKDEGGEQLHKYFMSGNTPSIWDKSAVGYICTPWVPICLITDQIALVSRIER